MKPELERCEARCNRTKAQHTNPVAHAFRTAEEEAREIRRRSEPSQNARARDAAVVLLRDALIWSGESLSAQAAIRAALVCLEEIS